MAFEQYYNDAGLCKQLVKLIKQKSFSEALKREGISPSDVRRLLRSLKHNRKVICDLFLEAVDNHDREKILEIADAVWFFRGFSDDPLKYTKDLVRLRLLSLKKHLLEEGAVIDIRTVAETLAEHGVRVGTGEDGFSALRRKCKQLGIPLVRSRKTKRK